MEFRLNRLLTRLLLGAAIPAVLFVGAALVAWFAIDRLIGAVNQEKHSREVLVEALSQHQCFDQMRLAVLAASPGPAIQLPEAFTTDHREFQELGNQIIRLVYDNPDQQGRSREILDLEAEWHNLVARWLGQPSRPGTGPNRQAVAFREQSAAVQQRLQRAMESFIQVEETLLAERRRQVAEINWQGQVLIPATGGLAVILAVVLTLQSARAVARPVRRLQEAADRLLTGEFRSIPPEGPDEVADLIVRFNHMAITLAERAGALQGQEERYRTYIAAVSHLLWTTDPDGRMTGDLPTWRAYTGQTEAEMRGLGWLDAVHPEDRPAVEQAWHTAVRERIPYEIEYRLRAASGAYRHFAVRGVPIINADGSVREWVGTCTDITERKREASLRQAKEAAEARSRAKSEFLTRMSHELRTPLNAVIGMSKMLATQRFGPLTPKQGDYIQDISQAGEHLLALINDVLDLAKVEAGKMDLNGEAFDLLEGVGSVLSTVRPLAEARKLTLTLTPCADGQLTTDPGRFRQILYNLLSNAIKFTPPGGSVTVECHWTDRPRRGAGPKPESEATAVEVAVRDTGVGIAPEMQEAIWDEFRQLRPGRTAEGTGLGLALTRRLVELLGGAIGLESAPGQGSTFTFALPRGLPQAPREDGVAVEPWRPLALVIEDHPPTNRLLCDWLADAGLATAPAFVGETGLARARELHPALVVLDLRLPRLDGWEVLTRLKSDPATARAAVVILTVDDEHFPTAGLGVSEFFVKPVEREAFLRRLRALHPRLFGRRQPVRALVVDDEVSSRKLLTDMLRAEGATVVEAADGIEALARLGADRFDLVVLDLLMPDADGFTVVENLKRRPGLNGVPVLVVTGKDVTAADRERLNGRIHALLGKDRLTPERLRRHLQSLGLDRAGTEPASHES
jgi:PAS domain S-box-containing protein